jgi:uncharacterized membrane protein
MTHFSLLNRVGPLAGLLLAGISLTVHAQTITTFDVPNATGTLPQGINFFGKSAGYYTDAIGGGTHGFLRKRNGAITTFDVQPSFPLKTFAYGINFFGEIVGTVQDQLNTYGFIRLSNGTIIEWNASGQPPASAAAPTEPGQPGSSCVVDGAGALAINAFRQTTGSVGIGCNTGYLRQWDGTITFFQVADPPENVAPQAINQVGQITGWDKSLSSSAWNGFLRQPDGSVVIFQVPNSTSMIPQGINLFGQIAGYYGDPNDPSVFHGFLRQPNGTIITFDPPQSIATQAVAINLEGQITGFYATADGVYHGFLRMANGQIKTFDVPGAAGTFSKDINDLGQIVGYYQDVNSVFHGFVRSPR